MTVVLVVASVASGGVASIILTGAALGVAGAVGGDGWMQPGSILATDLALNGIKRSFATMGAGCLKEFAMPIIKSSLVGSAGFVTEIIRKFR